MKNLFETFKNFSADEIWTGYRKCNCLRMNTGHVKLGVHMEQAEDYAVSPQGDKSESNRGS